MKRAARIIGITLLLAASFWVLTQPAAAQAQSTQPQQTNPLALDANPDVPQNLRTFTQGVVLESMAALSCILSGIDPTRPDQRCLGTDPVTGKLGFVQNGGAIGFMGNMIAVLYTPPAHTSDYFQSLAQNFGLAKPVYAQNPSNPNNGLGFNSLTPLEGTWRYFLRLVYLIFVIVFILIGIGIMLRLKIDPRTVMTIENQLPRIVVTLIFVTLSFAIAGFLIDMMFYTTYILINVLAGIPGANINIGQVNNTLYSPPMGFLNELTKNSSPSVTLPNGHQTPLFSLGGILDLTSNASTSITLVVRNLFMTETFAKFWTDLNPLVTNCQSNIPGVCTANAASGLLTNTIGTLVSNILGALITTIVGILGFLIILIAILIAMFKLWFQLIRAYVYILLDIILAPFWIMAGTFPGSTVSIGSWLRDMIANLSAFPVAIGMFLLGNIFMNTLGARGTTGDSFFFTPPLIGNPNLTVRPSFGSFTPDFNAPGIIGSLAAMGIILMTPKVVDMMRETLKAPNFKYTAAIGEALGASQGYVGGVIKKPWDKLTEVDTYGAKGTFAVMAAASANPWVRRFAKWGMGAHRVSPYAPGYQETNVAHNPLYRPPVTQPEGDAEEGATPGGQSDTQRNTGGSGLPGGGRGRP